MNRLRRFFATHKTFVISIGFLVAFSITVARATPPTSPYTAGQTLDPQCAPGAANCTVQVSPWTMNGTNTYYNGGNVGIGTSAPSSLLTISGTGTTLTVGGNANFLNSINVAGTLERTATIASWPNPGIGIFGNGTGTITDSQTAANTTLPNANVGFFAIDTLGAANTGVTYTNASSLYIAGAPVAGTNVSIGNALAFNVAQGNSVFGGNVGIGTTTPSVPLNIVSSGEQMRLQYDTGDYASFVVNSNGQLAINQTSNLPLYPTILNDGLTTNSNVTSANLYVPTSIVASSPVTTAQYLFGGSGNTYFRVGIRGSQAPYIVDGSSYASLVIGQEGVNTSYTGTNPLLAQEVIKPLSVGADGATVTNTATLYLENAATGGTNNYNLWVAGTGMNRFDGDVGIANTAPGFLLDVGSSAITTGTTVAEFQNAGGTCDITPNMTGGVICTSDMNLKKNITNLSDNSPWSFNNNITFDNQGILTKILALNPVDYNWNVEADGTQKHAGFIAQEVQQVFPDLVSTNPQTGILSLDYTGLIPYTVAAIQQMNLNVTSIDDLTKTDSWRDAIEHWLADSANGIQSIFSQQVVTPSLCVGTNGDMTCITKAQLDQLLSNQSGSTTVTSAPVITSSTSSPLPSDNDNTSQSPDVSAPVVIPPDQNQSTDTTGPDITTGLN